MAYTKTTWVEGGSPGISASNLNKIEQGVYEAHDQKVSKSGDTIRGLLKLYTGENLTEDVIRIGDRDTGYGFIIRYTGAEGSANNSLEIWSDNITGTPFRVIRITQNGVANIVFGTPDGTKRFSLTINNSGDLVTTQV